MGSSKSMTSGSMASARTMATRCFCPPESWLGYAPARSARPTLRSSSSAWLSASSLDLRRSCVGASVMFFSRVMWGNRLKCWNTMPIFWRWRLMFACLSVMSMPLNRICPSVGTSSRFKHRRKVDLPEPEGPMMTTTSPLRMSAETPSRALILPPAKCLHTLRALIMILSLTVSQPPFQFSYQVGKEHDHN